MNAFLNERKLTGREKVPGNCQQFRKTRKRCGLWGLRCLLTMASLAFLANTCIGQAAKAQSSLRTDKQFKQYGCDLPVEFQWVGLELRDQVDSLCRVQRIGLWFDRQLDGTRTLDLAAKDVTLHQALWLAAGKCDAGVALLDDAFYFGPQLKAAALPNLLAELEASVKSIVKEQAAIKKLLAPISFKAEAFRQPRETIARLAEKGDVTIIGIDQIPLDVWQAFELPKRPTIECIALCCYGFDLWPSVDAAGAISIQSLILPSEIRRIFPKIKQNMKAVEELATQFPAAKISDSPNGLELEGSLEAIAEMERRLAFKSAAKQLESAEKRYSISTEASRGNLLATMASQLTLELEYSPEAGTVLNEVIKIEFQDEPMPKILSQIMEGTGWAAELDGKKLKIRRK